MRWLDCTWLSGHEFEQILGDSEGQGRLCAAVHELHMITHTQNDQLQLYSQQFQTEKKPKIWTQLSNWRTTSTHLAGEGKKYTIYTQILNFCVTNFSFIFGQRVTTRKMFQIFNGLIPSVEWKYFVVMNN